MNLLYRDYPQGALTALHCHGGSQFCYLHRGGGVISSEAAGVLLVAGQLCLIPAGLAHEFRVLRHSRLSLIYLDDLDGGSELTIRQVSPLLAGLFGRLAAMAEPGLRDAYLTVLAAELRQAPVAAGFMLSAALDVRLLRVLERVCRHPSIEYGLAELAADSGASVRTLNRLFSQQLGCSFRQWRQQVVMGRARQLQQQGQPLSRIALELGYGDFSAFSHAFNRFLREPAGP
ncbi:AraC family transcriptional regulator [Aeromonas hydrophila]|uniref:AraC family transcriptional regulator n=1 Tax=Aeromonas hydrophila TaxID=644 RepID=UPI00080AA213|nr:AraC family transcriptional regulator [Aeromonas hydrophila]ANT69560.1 AraC family transcriptional regulator [Aeromonas hydrophila]